ncbi:hypothetical protein VTG60DRAFT_7306 [Thermothelomyces hinnuleus]
MHADSSRTYLKIRASAKRRAGDPQHSAIAELNGFGAVERSFDAVPRWVSRGQTWAVLSGSQGCRLPIGILIGRVWSDIRDACFQDAFPA